MPYKNVCIFAGYTRRYITRKIVSDNMTQTRYNVWNISVSVYRFDPYFSEQEVKCSIGSGKRATFQNINKSKPIDFL